MTNQISPAHYAKYRRQPIDFIADLQADYFVGNIIKYVVRYRDKGGIEDLRKAREYLRRIRIQAEKRCYVKRWALMLVRFPRRVWIGNVKERSVNWSVQQWEMSWYCEAALFHVVDYWWTLNPWSLVNAADVLDSQIRIEESKGNQ